MIDELLEQGALDAWLTPIVMKRGRPAVTVQALVREGSVEAAAAVLMQTTGTLGVRFHRVDRRVRIREYEQITVRGHRIGVKVARTADGTQMRREPEFRDVAAAAAGLGISEREMLDLARRAVSDQAEQGR